MALLKNPVQTVQIDQDVAGYEAPWEEPSTPVAESQPPAAKPLSLAALRDKRLTQIRTSGNNSYGTSFILELEEIRDENGKHVLIGKALFDGPLGKAGDKVSVVFRENEARMFGSDGNLPRGKGLDAGSVLIFDGVIKGTPHLEATWVTTAISGKKKKYEDEGHHLRALRRVWSQCPIWVIKNIHQKAGEPERIRFPVIAESQAFRVQLDGRWVDQSYDWRWLQQKIGDAKNSGDEKAIRVLLPTIDTGAVRQVKSRKDFEDAVRDFVNQGSTTLIRVFDGEEVLTRKLPYFVKREPTDTVEGYIESLSDRRQIQGEDGEITDVDVVPWIDREIPNASLMQAVESGAVVMEVMKASMLLFGSGKSKTVQALVKAYTGMVNGPAQDLKSYQFTYGNAGNLVDTVLVIQNSDQEQFKDGPGLLTRLPVPLDVNHPQTLATLPSPFIKVEKKAA